MSGVLDVSRPVEAGLVSCWDDMQELWCYTFFNQLKVMPENHAVLLTEPALNPKRIRQKTTEIMFEYFETPAFYMGVQSVLSLLATGLTTGIVLEAGHEATTAVPVYDGYVIRHAVTQNKMGGKDLTSRMAQLVEDRCPHPQVPDTQAQLMKENFCFVALDYNKEKQCQPPEERYELPDGSTVHLTTERFMCPEALFQPSLVRGSPSTAEGVHHLLNSSILKADADLKRVLRGKIVLSGGSSLFAGLGQRLCNEMRELAPDAEQVRVIAPPERKLSAWIGGSLLASLEPFRRMLISKHEYLEYGSSVVHQKCF